MVGAYQEDKMAGAVGKSTREKRKNHKTHA
jgi:hypothetical protein